MARLIVTRLLDMVPVLLAISVAAFLMIHLVPGDPATILLGAHATPTAVARLRHEMGLDKPLLSQYWDFISNAVRMRFGFSLINSQSVGGLIVGRLSPSLWLLAYSLVLSVLIAVPLATIAAVCRNGFVDQVIRVLSTVAFAMPSFWLGLLLIELVSLKLGLLPISGYGSSALQHFESLTLPALTSALALSPLLLRQLRSNMIDTMNAEFVEAARVRGLSGPRVMRRHVLRNSLTSTVTVLGMMAGVLLSQAVIVENVFSIPGLGSLLVGSVAARDFPTIQALALVFGVAVVLSSLVTDLIYAALDPRVRL